MISTWDIGGRRTRIAHPDGFYVDHDFLVTGEPTAIRENGANSGAGVLATYGWDNLGRRSSLTRGGGSVLSYSYDAVSRLTQLADNLVGTAYDQTLGFGYTPASQIASNTRSNDAYAWTGHYNLNRNYTANGRNQYSAIASITPTYDSKGNLTSAGAATYTYTSENLLTSASGGIALAYDPAMRLYQTSGGSAGTTRFAYDGMDLIAEYNGSNAMLRRYVHGSGSDEPLVWYEGSGTADRRFLHTDERGSVVAVTNSSGATLNINGYDEYGIPSAGNVGRFQYTGQTWLPELGMYYYKARIYSPTLGRFLQTDPIGFEGGMNLYDYVGGDPVNFTDPSGLEKEDEEATTRSPRKVCSGTRTQNCDAGGGISKGASPGSRLAFRGGTGGLSAQVYTCVKHCGASEFIPGPDGGTIVVTAPIYGWVSTGTHWFVRDGRFILNPYFEKSKYSDAFDIATGVFFAGPIVVIGAVELLGGGVAVGTPFLFSNAQIGQVVGWGGGRDAAAQALARAAQITRSEVARMRARGLTRDMAIHFRDLYRGAKPPVGGATAPARATLMQRILNNW